MNSDENWNYCFAAQSHLLGEGGASWNFTFTKQEPALAANKILLMASNVKVVRMLGATNRDDAEDDDLFIVCSDWPELQVRFGESRKEVISVLNRNDLEQAEDEHMQLDM